MNRRSLSFPPRRRSPRSSVATPTTGSINAGHVASRFVSVKPKAAAAKTSTNVHIISDHGNDYTLELKEVSADQAGGFDATVFLMQTDKDAQKKIAEAPVFVPVAEVKEKEDRLEREVAQAKAAAAAEKKTAEIRPGEVPEHLPQRPQFRLQLGPRQRRRR